MKCGIVLKLTVGLCLAANGNSIVTRFKKTRSLSLKAVDHKILVLLMLGLYGIMVLIQKFTRYIVCRTLRILRRS